MNYLSHDPFSVPLFNCGVYSRSSFIRLRQIFESLEFCIENSLDSLGNSPLECPVWRSSGLVGDIRAFQVHFTDKEKLELRGFSFSAGDDLLRGVRSVGAGGALTGSGSTTPANILFKWRDHIHYRVACSDVCGLLAITPRSRNTDPVAHLVDGPRHSVQTLEGWSTFILDWMSFISIQLEFLWYPATLLVAYGKRRSIPLTSVLVQQT